MIPLTSLSRGIHRREGKREEEEVAQVEKKDRERERERERVREKKRKERKNLFSTRLSQDQRINRDPLTKTREAGGEIKKQDADP